MIQKVSENLLTSEDYKTEHVFEEDVYKRLLHIPKGHLIIGKRHRTHTKNILLKGRMRVGDLDLGEYTDVCEGFEAVSNPFTQKVGYAYEDSIWCNVHETDEKDLKKLEEMLIISDEEFEQLLGKEKRCLGLL